MTPSPNHAKSSAPNPRRRLAGRRQLRLQVNEGRPGTNFPPRCPAPLSGLIRPDHNLVPIANYGLPHYGTADTDEALASVGTRVRVGEDHIARRPTARYALRSKTTPARHVCWDAHDVVRLFSPYDAIFQFLMTADIMRFFGVAVPTNQRYETGVGQDDRSIYNVVFVTGRIIVRPIII